MKIVHLPSLLADIIPPPPPDMVPGQFESRGFVSLGFLVFAVAAAGVLWWLRQRRVASLIDRS